MLNSLIHATRCERPTVLVGGDGGAYFCMTEAYEMRIQARLILEYYMRALARGKESRLPLGGAIPASDTENLNDKPL